MTKETGPFSIYRVDDGGEIVWAIAEDPEKARAISREYLRGDGPLDNEILDDEEITVLPMDKKLTLRNDEDDSKETLTVAGWILRNGPGFLATTCV